MTGKGTPTLPVVVWSARDRRSGGGNHPGQEIEAKAKESGPRHPVRDSHRGEHAAGRDPAHAQRKEEPPGSRSQKNTGGQEKGRHRPAPGAGKAGAGEYRGDGDHRDGAGQRQQERGGVRTRAPMPRRFGRPVDGAGKENSCAEEAKEEPGGGPQQVVVSGNGPGNEGQTQRRRQGVRSMGRCGSEAGEESGGPPRGDPPMDAEEAHRPHRRGDRRAGEKPFRDRPDVQPVPPCPSRRRFPPIGALSPRAEGRISSNR